MQIKSTICLFLLFSLCLSFPALVSAQTPTDEDDVIRVNTDVTNLPFTAVDQQRRFITSLRAEDIRVLEDGVPQQLFTFQRETNRPLAIAFLIDVSISQQYTLSNEKAAARGFIEKAIQSSRDQVAIIPFTGLAFLEQPLTRDVISVYRVLQQIEVAVPAYQGAGRPLSGIPTGPGLLAPPQEGTTAIWDAVALTSSEVLARSQGQRRRAIVLLTDGLDTTSRLRRMDAIDRVLSAEAVVYAIGIGDSKGEGVNKSAVRELAERTGGRAFFPKKQEDLQAAFTEIEQELRTQYLIAYSSTNKKRDGAYRRIAVEITNPDLQKEKLQIRHRPGYFAKRGS
ncbi:MAG TPA: VWA domain-containing protein [Pyrinomonadaceae bacterium]|nr:VWA domain-containing protein [Pyrinomonadaceae bacterium]